MSVTVKSKHEIELMREAGRILGTVLKELEKEYKKQQNLKEECCKSE